ncbi:Modification methylase Eco57IB [Hydrogenovibrio crunogenus]|uniref:site-specific DNA-methyltransferase (adenine-specific) n=1 Tax=Hydrogenovibrio crunogenus TaxID=39765 RepID=A0A4P7NXF4_9GAMM|nr:N-6 DNA methylase [Hydrogenovibrio crunogenus]QBZ82179.1 Modification methylase Eco57IB [Hydrogenovibrio crunogenus]
MKKSKLGQFYTPEYISELMSELVISSEAKEPLKIIDMTCGHGSLLKPLQAKLVNSYFHAYDIDSKNIEYLKQSQCTWDVRNEDSLLYEFEKEFYDISLGNPPFIKTKVTPQLADICERNYSGKILKIGTSIRAEIIFIAKYIEATKIGGRVSLILPESIISNEKMDFVRTYIFKNLRNISIYEINEQYFDEAEVRTYLVSGEKTINPDLKIQIGTISKNGQVNKIKTVDKKHSVLRADVKYLSQIERFKALKEKYTSLGEVIYSLDRGNKTKKQLEHDKTVFFHSSSFKEFETQDISLEGCEDLMQRYNAKHVAKKSDILIPRIGRSCHQHQALITYGNAVITDSVFRLNLPKKIAPIVFESLQTEDSKSWRDIHSKGSCTKLLTNSDILNLPIIGLNR